jgi:prophage regulatory protein
MTANENSAPRTSVATSIYSQQNHIKAHATNLHSRPARLDSGTFNVAPRPLKYCRGMPNNPNPLGALSEMGYILKSQLIPAFFPLSSATLRREAKSGTFPQPVTLGPRITAWRVEDIRGLIKHLGC